MMRRLVSGMGAATLGIAALLSVSAAQASWMMMDNFEGLTLGNIHGQNGWLLRTDAPASDPTAGNVVVDPMVPSNKVLAVTTKNARIRKAQTIANNTTATLFTRFRFTGTKNFSFGMSDIAAAGGDFNDYESQINMNNTANELKIRDAGTADVLTTLNPDTWYNLWMVIDNASDTTRVYLNTGMNGATSGNQLSNGGQTAFVFRNSGAAQPMLNLLVMTGSNPDHAGPLYLDDLYSDTGGQNLTNPVPEPGTFVLLLGGLLGLAMFGWRRKA